MPVSESTSVAQKATLSADLRQAAAALLRANTSPTVVELGELFTKAGYELALVGGPVRDVFLGGHPKDLDLTTDAVPERILAITRDWADTTWTVGIAFGTELGTRYCEPAGSSGSGEVPPADTASANSVICAGY